MEKPKLEYRQRKGEYGEIVEELTPESEVAHTRWLREQHFAKVMLRRLSNETTDAEGTTEV